MWVVSLLAAVAAIGIAGMAQAAAPATVPVGNPGNKADATGYGAVAYEYQIGKYEVTNAEYCEFLNAVAKSDPHRLYDSRMGGTDDRSGEAWGGITRKGWSGKYAYEVKPGKGKWPVGYITWESCGPLCQLAQQTAWAKATRRREATRSSLVTCSCPITPPWRPATRRTG